ncbi:hypothetical protein F7734_42275 [Scytonema sp. UIC 10036]|uniref:hypothetical protein n=1 Tax=Scytonema sp. UIC 10036 TaxID=2304196 RepID=UPI0012DA578C|nr:hypothetical protein [Scytonema sp. UIC 10036]MUG98569.1 hypothetical protein [Scytonema sp. UIC 10036]
MPSMNLLTLFNPSNYYRSGYITVPWYPIYQEFQIPPEELVLRDLRDLSYTPISAQVDRIDPEDSSRDVLVFLLQKAIPPGANDNTLASGFIRLDRGNPMPAKLGEPSVEIVYGDSGEARGVRLANNRLIVWFNLIPDPENMGRNWFSGSATSVQLDHQEILDPFLAARGEWLGQEPEKRCIQVAELLLPGLSHPKSPSYHVSLFDRAYRLVSQSSGFIRSSITIASEPFDYIGAAPDTGNNRHLVCELYRVISLYAGVDYLTEELFIKTKSMSEENQMGDSKEIADLYFVARYFAHMNMGLTEDIQQVFPVPNWFAIGSTADPYPAYGMAALEHIDTMIHPYEGNKSCFSWHFLPSQSVKCLHLFTRGQLGEFDTRVGHLWYEMFYQPLKAEIYQDVSFPQAVTKPAFALP